MLNDIIRVYIYIFMACICVTHTFKIHICGNIIYRIFDIFNLFYKKSFFYSVAPEAPPDTALFKVYSSLSLSLI